MIRRSDITVFADGVTPEPGVYVTVKDDTGALATLYDDAAALKANPFTSDAVTGAFYYNIDDSDAGGFIEEYRLSLSDSPRTVRAVYLSVMGATGPPGPAGPAGDVAKVADRTALAGIVGMSFKATRYLAEVGREGMFVFDSANLAAKVTSDPGQGVYVPPAAAPTGAGGSWARVVAEAPLIPQKFYESTDPDFSAAISRAINYLDSLGLSGFGYGQGTPKLFVPHGLYDLHETIDLTHSKIVEGEQGADAGGGATVLRFAGCSGFRTQAHNTTGATGTQASAAFRGDGSIIRNLFLKGDYTAADAEYHGVHLRAKATIRDCYISGFRGDGVYANATAGSGGASEGNVNCFELSRLIIQGCRNGVYLVGADANAGAGHLLDVMDSRSRGIDDQSFLGNTWTACHTSGNVGNPYRSNNNNARCVFVGCYSESGQPASSFVTPTLILGGQHAAGVTGDGAWLRGEVGYAKLDKLAVAGAAGASTTLDNLGATVANGGNFHAVNGSGFAAYSGNYNGTTIAISTAVNFGGTIQPGISATFSAGGRPPFWIASSELAWMGADGFVHWTLTPTGMDLGGVYKVNAVQVVGARGAAVVDATDAASAITQLNALLARCRAHGLIAP